MENRLPRIEFVKVDGPSTVRVRWKGQRSADIVDLAGWIATGGEILAPLKDPGVFTRAGVGGYGSAVEWDDGDLAIDAVHLKLWRTPNDRSIIISFANGSILRRVSNAEAADLVGVSASTWASYRVCRRSPNPLLLYAKHRCVIHCGCRLISSREHLDGPEKQPGNRSRRRVRNYDVLDPRRVRCIANRPHHALRRLTISAKTTASADVAVYIANAFR